MKTHLLILLCILSRIPAIAQLGNDVGAANDSFFIHFHTDTVRYYTPDTSSAPLWQIGRTLKPFFTTDTAGVLSIMTDSTHPYPINANNYFIISFPAPSFHSTIFSFWHRYQTDSGKDGCIVELSQDNGATWFNITDTCSLFESTIPTDYVLYKDGIYHAGDTLLHGDAAFSGSCSTSRLSRFLLESPPGAKISENYNCSWYSMDSFFVRFRFVSDATPDTLAGWLIDSIRVTKHPIAPGNINDALGCVQLPVFPNPSPSGSFTFPSLPQRHLLTITIVDMLGRVVISSPYTQHLSLSSLPTGVYFYFLSGIGHRYSGKLIYQ